MKRSRRLRPFLLAWFFGAGCGAHAVIGPARLLDQIKTDAACRLVFYDENRELAGLCSGTLISPTEILTAGHCVVEFKDQIKIAAQCGYRGVKRDQVAYKQSNGLTFMIDGPSFAEVVPVISGKTHPLFDWSAHAVDAAIVTLEKPISLRPLSVASLASLPPNAKCFSTGFGLANDGTGGVFILAKYPAAFSKRGNI